MKKSSGFWIMKSLLFCMCLFFVISSGCTGERGHNGLNGKNGINGINNLTMNLTPNMTANSSSFYNNSYALLRGQFGGQILNGGRNTGENLTLNASANGVGNIIIYPSGGGKIGINTSILNSLITFGDASSKISTDTTDGSDNKRLQIGGGGGLDVSRGAYISLFGNEFPNNAGNISIFSGSTGKGIGLNNSSATRSVSVGGSSGGIQGWVASNNNEMAYLNPATTGTQFALKNENGIKIVFDSRAGNENYIIQNNFSLGTTTSTAQFDITQYMRERTLGAGTLMSDSNGVHYVISDPKLKTDIKPYVSGLKEILSIPSSAMITYKFRPESGLDTKNEYSGFDASILSSAIPEAVFSKLDTQWIQQKTGKLVDGEDEYTSIELPKLNEKGEQTSTLSISDRPIIAAQITAIQELNAKIEAQQAQIDNLTARIAKLEKGVKP